MVLIGRVENRFYPALPGRRGGRQSPAPTERNVPALRSSDVASQHCECLQLQVVDEVLSLFGKRKREARAKYRQFVADGVALGKREELGGERRISRGGTGRVGCREI